ncbi:conserved hypothetical protein [Neospora caninum Liverpool]|uniref:Uncharacterized protein n=1 Tax=Neospora caninum (strain Liverpool) TaxID=572307 RepID=F0VIG4_NEOCL|nr:conserved hypothetical protein [Neospora caninum Liverpool]CBZ53525.1 conserved hypothetical protein [Neospora caninum Liverpool]CEL67514.1 TPA: hypothetical protein BN1204_033130 [Neospora caninum Liverpool]|eukprot:XP_003883557.1 conserved hypothetical protein [Neospora caninum Liverpool]
MTAMAQTREDTLEPAAAPSGTDTRVTVSCHSDEESVALRLVDERFHQHLAALQRGEVQGRRVFPSEEWGDIQALRDAFLENGEQLVDLNLLGDVSEQQLLGLTGKVCRYRGLVQQPLNTEFYAGAVPCPHSCKKSPGQVVWHTSKYRDTLRCCSALGTSGEDGFRGNDSLPSSEFYSLSAAANFPSSALDSDEHQTGLGGVLPVQIWNRWPYHCVSVPGETAWCRRLARRSTRPEAREAESFTRPGDEERVGRSPVPAALDNCTLLLYTAAGDDAGSGERCAEGIAREDGSAPNTSGEPGLLLNDLIDAVGILSVLPASEGDSAQVHTVACASSPCLEISVKPEPQQGIHSRCLCTTIEGASTQSVASKGMTFRLHVFDWKRVCFFNPVMDRCLFHSSLSRSVVEKAVKVQNLKNEDDAGCQLDSSDAPALQSPEESKDTSVRREALVGFLSQPSSQQGKDQQLLPLVNQKTTSGNGEHCPTENVRGNGGARSGCNCSFSHQSRTLMTILESLVPRLVGVSVRPRALATSSMTPKLLLDDASEDTLGRLARGALQLARGTILLIDEPEVVSKRTLDDACRRIVEADARSEQCKAPSSCVKRESGALHDECEYGSSSQPGTGPSLTEAKNENEEKERKKQQAKKLEELNQKAAENLRALETLVADGHVSYDFIFSKQRVATDTINICMTSSLASSSVFAPHLLPVPVEITNSNSMGPQNTHRASDCCGGGSEAGAGFNDATEITSAGADGTEGLSHGEMSYWRALVGAASRREQGVDIAEETRQMMIEDWVRIRQEDRSVKSDDFTVWLVLADSMSASFGEGCSPLHHSSRSDDAVEKCRRGPGQLSPEHWKRVMDLERQRRARLAAPKISG